MNEDSSKPSTSRLQYHQLLGNPCTTERGGRKLIRQGYEYVIKKKNKDKSICGVAQIRSASCFATVKTTSDVSNILNETSYSHDAPMGLKENEIKYKWTSVQKLCKRVCPSQFQR